MKSVVSGVQVVGYYQIGPSTAREPVILLHVEKRLAAQPSIVAPGIVLHGVDDGVDAPEAIAHDAPQFSGPYAYRLIPSAGHNLPQEAPAPYADAVLSVA